MPSILHRLGPLPATGKKDHRGLPSHRESKRDRRAGGGSRKRGWLWGFPGSSGRGEERSRPRGGTGRGGGRGRARTAGQRPRVDPLDSGASMSLQEVRGLRASNAPTAKDWPQRGSRHPGPPHVCSRTSSVLCRGMKASSSPAGWFSCPEQMAVHHTVVALWSSTGRLIPRVAQSCNSEAAGRAERWAGSMGS